MEQEYNTLLEEIKKIEQEKSTSFESSLLYQKEIISFLGEVKSLKGQYSSVESSFSSIKSKYKEENYKNTFASINEMINKVKELIVNLEEVNSKITSGSQKTYSDLSNKFDFIFDTANSCLELAKTYIDKYNQCIQRINSLDSSSPNYAEEYQKLCAERDNCETNAKAQLNNVEMCITTLNESLEKGMKKA